MKARTQNITLAVAAIFLLAGFQSRANETVGLFVEPGITIESGTSAIDYPTPFSNSSGTLKGLGLLGRFGVHASEAIFVAADLRYSMPNFRDSTNNFEAAAEAYNYGISAGLQMPDIGLRIWGGYIIGGMANPGESKGVDVKFEDGTGYRVGAGFRIAMFSVNLEYQAMKYAKTIFEKIGPITGSSDNLRYSNDSFILSGSFPLEL